MRTTPGENHADRLGLEGPGGCPAGGDRSGERVRPSPCREQPSPRTAIPRIAFVCGNLVTAEDGVADYTIRLAETLRHDIDPVLITSGRVEGDLGPTRVVTLERGWGPAGIAATATALRRLRPDLVHLQFAPSAFGFSPAVGLPPPLAGRRVPWVTTLHEYGWWAWPSWLPAALWRRPERHGWWDRETLTLVPHSRALVVTNPEHAAAVRTRFGRQAQLVPVAANIPRARSTARTASLSSDAGPSPGADPSPGVSPGQAARSRLRGRLGTGPDAEVAVFFGFVHPVKGVRYLLEAVAELHADHPDLHLAVVGGFTSLALPDAEAAAFRRELEGHARAVGVADRVTFTGHLPAEEVSDILAGADVCVLPFTAGVTTKSGALAAALSHGLPTVVTVADPPDPALVDGRTAIVAKPVRDPAALARGLRRLLGNPALRAAVSAGGRDLVADRSWPSVGAAHARLYRCLIGPR
ncbi:MULTISPECIES: glycosyltransferase [unclassified Frankia]